MTTGAITLEFNTGETLKEFSLRLIALVEHYYGKKKKNTPVLKIVGVFKGVRLIATKSSTSDTIQRDYERFQIAEGKVLSFEASAGEHIDKYAKRLVEKWKFLSIKKTDKFVITGSFNGTSLMITGKTTPKMISDRYSEESRKSSEAYRKTDEYKQEEVRQKQETSDLQNLYNGLMVTLPMLDFKNYDKVLDFTSKYHTATDHIGVKKDHSIFIKALEEKGYIADANVGDNYKENDQENNARYLIGQFLGSTKRNGCCPQVFDTFYKKYVDKFRKVTA